MTNTTTESPTAIACPTLENPVLSVSVNRDRTVTVVWNPNGGCGPFVGSITVRYEGESPYTAHQIGTADGSLLDRPPARCGGTKTLVYTFQLRDRAGQEVMSTADASITWPC